MIISSHHILIGNNTMQNYRYSLQIQINKTESQIKYTKQAAFVSILINFSPTYYGYCLTMMATAHLDPILNYYSSGLPQDITLALLNGSLPVGGMFGSFVFPYFLKRTTKKKMHYYLTLATAILCGLQFVPWFPLLVLIRFLMGILSAHYMPLAPNLIKDHFTDDLWKPYGALYSAMRIIGMLLSFLLGEPFIDGSANIPLFIGPFAISLIQSIGVYFFLPQSPVELLKHGETGRAVKALSAFFDRQNIPRRIQELEKRISRAAPPQEDTLNNPNNLCGIHLSLLRQFCGVTYLVIYASQIPINQSVSLGNNGIIIENAIQTFGGLLGILMITCVSRYYLVCFSTILLCGLSVIIGIGSYFQLEGESFSAICIFMVICGAALTSVAWAHPPYICSVSYGKVAGCASMTGTALIAVIPPFIVEKTQDHIAYPIFFFFSAYMFISIFLNVKWMPQDYLKQVQMKVLQSAVLSWQ